MVAEHWVLGEAVQDAIITAGYEHPTVEGIAVDLHDLLQAADRIREVLGPQIVSGRADERREALEELAFEFEHIRWHCDDALAYLASARQAISGPA